MSAWTAVKPKLFALYLAIQAPLREGGWIARVRLLRKASRWLYRHLKCGRTVDILARGAVWRMDIGDGYFTQGMVVEGDNEEWETGVFLGLLREGMTMADVGAHIGWYSVLSSRRVGQSGRVVAFEPDPTNCGLLRENLALNRCGNAEVVEKAIGDRAGRVAFVAATGNRGNNRIGPATASEFEVGLTSLDEQFEARNWAVDVIKMDIQGAEMAAWRGMQELLRRRPELRIMMEFCPPLLKEHGVSHEELFAEYGRLEFIPYRIDERLRRLVTTDLADVMRVCDQGRSFTNVFLTRRPFSPDEARVK